MKRRGSAVAGAIVAATGLGAGFTIGHATAPASIPAPAIGTAVAHYPPCPTWTPGHFTPGPCVGAKP